MMEDEDDKKFLRDQRALLVSENLSFTISNTDMNEPLPMEIENAGPVNEQTENLTDVVHDMVADKQNENLANLDNDMVANASITQPAPKDLLEELLGPETESPISQGTPPMKRRANELFITEKLAITLDKCKISIRDAMHLLMATAEALGVDTRPLVINTTCIYEARQKFRKTRFEAIKKLVPDLFSDLSSTIHWDGKLLSEYLRKETKDRLAINITGGEMEQLLGVPKLASGSGENQAQAVFDSLTDWSLTDNIQALCCDSTASNTGWKNGACVILERLLGRDLLYLICRHHMYELVLKCVFEAKFEKSTGPDVPLFREFGNFWKSIDQTKYEPGTSDRFVNESLQDVREEILEFCTEYLRKDLARSDYKEFLELVVIFLGGQSPEDITFHPPGAIHHARWMAKGIYSLRMFIFRKQFLVDKKDLEIKCRDVCIFLIRVYTQAWFRAPLAAQAPNQDLNFLKCLYNYKHIDKSISEDAVNKFKNNLWYLTPEMAALAFFDDNISTNEKLKMCLALQSISSNFLYGKRILTNERTVIDLVDSNISDFVCKNTYKFFERFKINVSFLKKDPTKWKKDRDYIYGLQVVKNLKVVNDVAERGVKLMSDFNKLLTKDPEQIQYLLSVINDYRSLFPDSNKATLMKPYE